MPFWTSLGFGVMGENTDQAMGFRGVPDTTVLAGTSTGALLPYFPPYKYSTAVNPCKYLYT
jgi:hypothetical protein